VESAFNQWWPRLEPQITEIALAHRNEHKIDRRTLQDMVEEILQICRGLQSDRPPESPESLKAADMWTAVARYDQLLAELKQQIKRKPESEAPPEKSY
jgi:hypothetical protein